VIDDASGRARRLAQRHGVQRWGRAARHEQRGPARCSNIDQRTCAERARDREPPAADQLVVPVDPRHQHRRRTGWRRADLAHERMARVGVPRPIRTDQRPSRALAAATVPVRSSTTSQGPGAPAGPAQSADAGVARNAGPAIAPPTRARRSCAVGDGDIDRDAVERAWSARTQAPLPRRNGGACDDDADSPRLGETRRRRGARTYHVQLAIAQSTIHTYFSEVLSMKSEAFIGSRPRDAVTHAQIVETIAARDRASLAVETSRRHGPR